MAISKTVDGPNTTVTFEYTGETTKVENTLTDAAKYLYGRIQHGVALSEGQTVDDLTPAQIGQICDTFVKKSLKDMASKYHLGTASQTAIETAQAELNTRHF